jgi:hypothetical protein
MRSRTRRALSALPPLHGGLCIVEAVDRPVEVVLAESGVVADLRDEGLDPSD